MYKETTNITIANNDWKKIYIYINIWSSLLYGKFRELNVPWGIVTVPTFEQIEQELCYGTWFRKHDKNWKLEEKSRTPETKNLLTDANSRTNTILKRLQDLSPKKRFFFFFFGGGVQFFEKQ